jgi:FkbM family methyltransferase
MNHITDFHRTDIFETVHVNGHEIKYMKEAAGWRYATLAEKEPETIEWIDTFEPGDVFWDIGANIGIYSVYAAKRGIKTVAFEPHFANYHQLCISTCLNQLEDRVTPICVAFSESRAIDAIHLASVDVGTSMSSFGNAVDFRGRPYKARFKQGMIGYDIDGFIRDFSLEVPTHIKIDVDGLELSIVKGALETLRNPKLKSVSIELIDSDLAQVTSVKKILTEAGLQFVHKKQNGRFATPDTRDVLNFLFHRNPEVLEKNSAVSEPLDWQLRHVINAIAQDVAQKIESASLETDPCENIYLENVFPPGLYQELTKRLPSIELLNPINHPDAVTPDGRVTRYLLDLTETSISRLREQDRPLWAAVVELFKSEAISLAIVRKFSSTFRARFGNELPELVAVPILYRDMPGYRIGIHPDAPSKVATLQFYLPEDDSQSHLGTVFHRRIGSRFLRLKKNTFAPNSGYAFARTEESWHSVDELAPFECARNSIALTFYIKGQEYSSESVTDGADGDAAPVETNGDAYVHSLAKSFTRREHVVQLFPSNAIGVELGVAAGDFSERILKHEHVAYLFSIDMWAGDRGHGVEQYREAIVRLDPYRARNSILRMRFDEALSLFGDESLDFVYVDGYAHDGELNGQTFRDWYPKLRPGGIISGDDYSPEWPRVVAAVNRFAEENGLDVHIIDCHEDSWNSKYPTWFAIKPKAE